MFISPVLSITFQIQNLVYNKVLFYDIIDLKSFEKKSKFLLKLLLHTLLAVTFTLTSKHTQWRSQVERFIVSDPKVMPMEEGWGSNPRYILSTYIIEQSQRNIYYKSFSNQFAFCEKIIHIIKTKLIFTAQKSQATVIATQQFLNNY